MQHRLRLVQSREDQPQQAHVVEALAAYMCVAQAALSTEQRRPARTGHVCVCDTMLHTVWGTEAQLWGAGNACRAQREVGESERETQVHAFRLLYADLATHRTHRQVHTRRLVLRLCHALSHFRSV